jgi:hypothetical protein
MRYTTRVILLATFLPLIWGCGVYTFNPRGKSEIESIAVQPFENETAEFGLADRLTEIVIDAFIADGNLKVVSPEHADALLQGTLTYYDRVPETFDQNDQVQTYKVVMDFKVTLKDAQTEDVIWSETSRQEGPYDANTEREEDGQQRAGELLVQMIINKTTKSW